MYMIEHFAEIEAAFAEMLLTQFSAKNL